MTDDSNNLNLGEPEPTPSGPTSNRTFILVAGIIGALAVLALIIFAIYALVVLPRNRTSYQATLIAVNQANTSTVAALTSVAATLHAVTPTLPPPTATQPLPPTATTRPSSTPVVAQATSTNTPVPTNATVDPRTATVSALLTQAAQAKLTTTLTTSTALPKTGFADEAGLPALLGIAVLLIVVIFLVRRMRSSPAG